MRPAIILEIDPEHRKRLEFLANSGRATVDMSKRAKIILAKARGLSAQCIADELGINRHTVDLWVNKYRNRKENQTVDEILSVSEGRGRKPVYSGEARTWIVSESCKKPKDYGYPPELWTYTTLTNHIHTRCAIAGFSELAKISRAQIYSILEESKIKPFRVRYYCESKDPEFDKKLHNILLLYKLLQVQLDNNDELCPFSDGRYIHVISYDEKPGIQVIDNVGADLPPEPEKKGHWSRDYQYKRKTTISLLAGLDLQTGEVIPLLRDTHTSYEYIEFLQCLDRKYPKGDLIRVVLDNLSVHKSKETIKYLQLNHDRFDFIFTPTHGSWTNIIESFFSKLSKQCLNGIRVKHRVELMHRIYDYFDEINKNPVIYKWQWHLDDIDIAEELQTTALIEKL